MSVLHPAYARRVQRTASGLQTETSDQAQQLLAIVEAEVGSLVEFLPVPVLVTSETGEVVRSNPAAGIFLDCRGPLIGQHIDKVLLGQTISVRMRRLSHAGQAVRLYVLQGRSDTLTLGAS